MLLFLCRYATKRSYDPVDYESIDKTEFWIMEEGELDFSELEDKLFEEYPKDGEELNHGMILKFISKYKYLKLMCIYIF